METLGTRLRQARIKKKFSLPDLHNLTGIPTSTIQKIEDGRSSHPRGVTLGPLATMLEIDECYLMYGVNQDGTTDQLTVEERNLALNIRNLKEPYKSRVKEAVKYWSTL